MRVERIDVFQVDLPYSGGLYRLSGGREYRSFDSTIVRITTDDGTEGWGESTPFGGNYVAAHALGVRAGVAELAPAVLGRDPRAVDRLTEAMDDVLAGHWHAKSPIDVACWDVFGKSVGLPVCELLGGSTRTPMGTISSIGSGDPEEMRARVAEHRARGYLGHSVKIGASDAEGGPAIDAARVEACLADRRPGEYFLVDANAGMSPEAVLRFLRLMPPDADIVLESPCATWAETRSVRARTNVPMVLDELAQSEVDVVAAIRDDVADGIGLKISKAGGLTRSRRVRDLCLAAGMTMSVQDVWGSEIAFAAIVHLAATVPPQSLRCILDTRDVSSVVTAWFEPVVSDDGILAPSAPGLGVTPDLTVLGDPVATYAV